MSDPIVGPWSAFYDAGRLGQIAINLFYGWGYNFYKLENQLRADDLMIRARIGWLLGDLSASLEAAQGAYRKKCLPPPSREQPRPAPEAIAKAQSLEELCGMVRQLEGRIRALPVPENDRMTQRYRLEAPSLAMLCQYDSQMVGGAQMLREMLKDKDFEWVLANLSELRSALGVIRNAAQDRQRLVQ